MLTYAGSTSRKVTGNAPDENYAREVMQLFSMGLYKLHENGTRITDAKGEPELAYSTDAVATLPAGWTGFGLSGPRANVKDAVLMAHNTRHTRLLGIRVINVIDPMHISGAKRDRSPKTTPTNGYIGDGQPLCADLPKHNFLMTGAEFRYRGSNVGYDKLVGSGGGGSRTFGGDGAYKTTSGADFELKTTSALLYKVLCGAAPGTCKFKSVSSRFRRI
jgi:hypothetical protein